jgi:hypothetical protein
LGVKPKTSRRLQNIKRNEFAPKLDFQQAFPAYHQYLSAQYDVSGGGFVKSSNKDGPLQTINSSDDNEAKRTISRMQKSRASVTASQVSRKPTLKVSNITFEEDNGSVL